MHRSAEDRLARLEREVRLWRCALGVMAVIAVISMTAAHFPAAQAEDEEARPPAVLRAERFEVVDANGKRVAVLGVFPPSSPGLALYDPRSPEDMRAQFALQPGGAGNLVLFGETGSPLISLQTDMAPELQFWDKGQVVTKVGIGPQGHALVALFDRSRQARVSAHVARDGTPGIEVYDAEGKPVWSVPGE